MGRPLNKKYFGNRNIGGSGTTDDYGIGGEGVASVVLNALGSYTTRPTITFPSPGLPTGVLATGTITSRAKTLTAGPSGTQTKAYKVGQVLTLGTNGTTATVATLAATVNLASVTIGTTANLTYNTTTTARLPGTSVVVSGTDTAGCGLIPSTYFVSASPAPTATSCTLTDTYANALAGTNNLGATVSGATTGLSFATGNGGAAAAGALATVSTTPTAVGSYEALVTGAQTTTTVGGGVGATITVSAFEAASVVITEEGSGYTSAPAANTLTFSQSVTATSVALTTTPVDPITGSSTYQENAIQLTAFIPLETQAGWVSGYSGSSAVAGDIVRQSGNGKFIARTAQGVGRVKLVGYLGSNVSPTAGEAIITASDYDGGSYYVTKISDRRCNIIGYTGSVFTTTETGVNVPWTFNGYEGSGDKVDNNQPYLIATNVKINNA